VVGARGVRHVRLQLYTPNDDTGECVFVGPGDPDEAVTVHDLRVEGGSYKRDVGRVRYPDGTTRLWRYEEIQQIL
jgi:hypothetical protein